MYHAILYCFDEYGQTSKVWRHNVTHVCVTTRFNSGGSPNLKTELNLDILQFDTKMIQFWTSLLLCSFAFILFCQLGSTSPPNIFFLMVDDLGWADVNFHRNDSNPEINTPFLDNLVEKESLELLRHYVHYSCTPTRSSFQSGRMPYRVQETLLDNWNSNSGIPRNMTCIAEKMVAAGYTTHIVGKWDAGMASFEHTPEYRGYNTSLIYFGHLNDYYTKYTINTVCNSIFKKTNFIDFWHSNNTNKINQSLNYNEPFYDIKFNNKSEYKTMYEEYIFSQNIYQIIDSYNNSGPDNNNSTNNNPFFIVYTPHISHWPIQVPPRYYNKYNYSNDENKCGNVTSYINSNETDRKAFRCRNAYYATINILDDIINNIVNKLKSNNLWNNTLFVLTADNGGCVRISENAGNNYPMRGGKYSPFEGGIRGTAFVSGGYLPKLQYGKKLDSIMHVVDWYITFCLLAGNSKEFCYKDVKSENYNNNNNNNITLPGIEGYNMWPLISGINNTSPRVKFMIDNHTFISGNYKLIIHNAPAYAGWTGIQYPNTTSMMANHSDKMENIQLQCGTGCVFDIKNDWTEHINLSDNTTLLNQLINEWSEYKKDYYTNNERGENSCPKNSSNITCSCWMAANYWNGFAGPWQYFNINE